MRHIYISPHFDDAVLSCGGLISAQARQGSPVEIWTVFAGNPPPGPLSAFALEIHALWGTGNGEETIALRKDEDRLAAARVGAKVVHFEFQDCIYRRGPDGEPLYPESVFVAPHPIDTGLPVRIAAALASELLPGDMLVGPLALGAHVDHLLARQALESLGRPLLQYYADFPYLVNYPEALSLTVGELSEEFFAIGEESLEAWLEGVAAYASQLSSLLHEKEGSLEEALRLYWAERRGICLWRA
ncbi:MAG: PIG-L family deacetylase [Anaerolineales bacterium]|nr:PIG-L family deacetylase [Anaerolineales bacterium]